MKILDFAKKHGLSRQQVLSLLKKKKINGKKIDRQCYTYEIEGAVDIDSLCPKTNNGKRACRQKSVKKNTMSMVLKSVDIETGNGLHLSKIVSVYNVFLSLLNSKKIEPISFDKFMEILKSLNKLGLVDFHDEFGLMDTRRTKKNPLYVGLDRDIEKRTTLRKKYLSNPPIPPHDINADDPFKILGLQPSAGKDDIMRNYRLLSVMYHPDKGGSEKLFNRLTNAKNEILATIPEKEKSLLDTIRKMKESLHRTSIRWLGIGEERYVEWLQKIVDKKSFNNWKKVTNDGVYDEGFLLLAEDENKAALEYFGLTSQPNLSRGSVLKIAKNRRTLINEIKPLPDAKYWIWIPDPRPEYSATEADRVKLIKNGLKQELAKAQKIAIKWMDKRYKKLR